MTTELFCCILHERITSAFASVGRLPVHKFVVTYNGRIGQNTVFCEDEGSALVVEISKNTIQIRLGFKKYNKGNPEWEWIDSERSNYVLNEVKLIDIPICDATEAWRIIITDQLVTEDRIHAIMPGYKKEYDGLYSCIKDISESNKHFFPFMV